MRTTAIRATRDQTRILASQKHTQRRPAAHRASLTICGFPRVSTARPPLQRADRDASVSHNRVFLQRRARHSGESGSSCIMRLASKGIMLDGHVLVLNRLFQAVQITSVRRALTLLYKGQVKAVDSEYRTYDFENWADIPVQPTDHYVVTPSRNILIPPVVQLLT